MYIDLFPSVHRAVLVLFHLFSLVRPCWFTVFLIFEVMEVALIQDDYEVDMVVGNVFMIMINAFGAILCVYQTVNHIKGDRRNQWDRLNIATKYEGTCSPIAHSVLSLSLSLHMSRSHLKIRSASVCPP